MVSQLARARNTILNTGPRYGIICVVERARKITVEVPSELLDKAQRASGAGITQTIRTGLQLVAATRTYARLRQFRGWVAYLEGGEGEDAQLLDQALENRQVVMAPVVLTELLSDPQISSGVAKTLLEIPLIEIESGFWQRAGILRARVLAKRRRVRLGDALIAQCCLDRGISLLTRDRDFRTFAQAAGLDLVIDS